MTAVRALTAALAAGISLRTDGLDLQLLAGASPPSSVLKGLAEHKSEILPLLSSGFWPDPDCLVLFEERAAIAEYDGGRSRAEAEAMAWDECVSELIRRNGL